MFFKRQSGLLSVTLLLLLIASACGPGETPAPADLSKPDAAVESASELVLRLELEDDTKVHSVAFSPDGRLLAGGMLMEARLWSVDDGGLVRSIEKAHTAEDLSFSPDGLLLGAGLGSGGVQLSRVADGTKLPRLHTGFKNRLAFSPDGEVLATGNRSGIVWLWRVEDREQLAELAAPTDEWITALAFSPDGETLAAGHWDGAVYLWRVADGRLLHTLEPQTDRCHAAGVAFSPDGSTLAVAGARHEWDHVVALWNVAGGRLDKLLPLSGEAKAVAFSPDGRFLAAGSAEGIRLWQMLEAELLLALDHVAEAAETDWVTSLTFSPDSTMLAAARWIGVLELWRIAS